MTLLAFYWGAGAVWPKCRKNDGERTCQQPLLTEVLGRKDGAILRCSLCKDVANWRCPVSQHGYALCNKCVKIDHKHQIGKRSPGSSTDVYDAAVERETTRRDGQVYILTEVESRRAPKVPPNWKTSYRIQCSGLVAVLNLDASHVPLNPDQEIFWAQIVPTDEKDQKKEYQFRSRGQMAIRLLNRGDIGTLQHTLTPSLDIGARIAIIDLRVFVPEVVPVLAACCDQALTDHLTQIPFAQQLIGKIGKNDYIEVPDGNVTDMITHVIRRSNIEVIRRLSPDSQTLLIRDLSNIAIRSHLRGAQLNAFTSALSNSLSCIQGPPGKFPY